MIEQHKPDLAEFLTLDDRGRLIPDFIADLANCLGEEQASVLAEVQSLTRGIDHIKQIVAAQQSMAKKSNVATAVNPAGLMETALNLQPPGLVREVRVRQDCEQNPQAMLDQHKVLQILINLIANAAHAVMVRPEGQREIALGVAVIFHEGTDYLRFEVRDNGMGIAPENLARIFSHGFTTKKEGHGFGLHGAANAAREMGGRLSAASAGLNCGATFTLDLPFLPAQEQLQCKA
jgi:C4-dicarboxylate-specific signal transduction histidine kinase